MKPTMPYYVIIPAYKPDEVLIDLTRQVCDRGWQLIVVNDGSGAEFDAIFANLDPRATILVHKVNQGKGAGIKTGLAHIQALLDNGAPPSIVGIMDADGQHLPDDMQQVLEAAVENFGDEDTPAKLALGVRVIDGKMPARSRFGNTVTRWVFHLVSGTKVSDTQTGLRAFTTEMIPLMLDIDGDRYEYEINVLSMVARRHYGFCEVPIKTIYRDRENSTSHFRVIRDSVRIYRSLLKYVISSLLSFVLDFSLCWLFFWLLTTAGHTDTLATTEANVMARVISSTFNYFMNCNVVFKNKPTIKNAMEYILLCAFNIGLSIGLQYLLGLLPSVSFQFCKLLAETCMFILSYFVQKKIIFKRKSKYRKPKV